MVTTITKWPTLDADFSSESVECQASVRALLECIDEVNQLTAGGLRKGDAIRRVARRATDLRLSESKLERLYYDYAKREDWRVLVNRSRFPEPAAKLPYQFIEMEWKPLCLMFQRDRTCKSAHRALLDKWRQWRATGEKRHALIGYAAPPEPSGKGIPRGWSVENLRHHRPDAWLKTAANIGLRKASALQPTARTTRVGLPVGAIYEFDDQYYDFMVNFLTNKKAVRLRGYNVIDRASHCAFTAGYKPQIIRKDGSKADLTEADFMWFVIHVLTDYGFRTDIGTDLVIESGTATIRDGSEFAGCIARINAALGSRYATSMDLIRPRKGPTNGGASFDGGHYRQSRGNFRYKSTIEGYFAIERAWHSFLPGQVGKDRDHSPEELVGLERENRKLLEISRNLPAEQAALLRSEVMLCAQAIPAVTALRGAINARRDHDLEGWAQCGYVRQLFRMLPNSEEWVALDEMERLPEPVRDMARALIQSDPATYVQPVRMSPLEVFNRGVNDLRRLPAHAWPGLIPLSCAKEAQLAKDGTRVFDDWEADPDCPIMYLGSVVNEHGRKIQLKRGETYLWYVNPYNPEECQVAEAAGSRRGAWIGTAHRFHAVSPLDKEALGRNFGRLNAWKATEQADLDAKMAWLKEDRAERIRHNESVICGDMDAPDVIESRSNSARRAQTARELADSIYADGDYGAEFQTDETR